MFKRWMVNGLNFLTACGTCECRYSALLPGVFVEVFLQRCSCNTRLRLRERLFLKARYLFPQRRFCSCPTCLWLSVWFVQLLCHCFQVYTVAEGQIMCVHWKIKWNTAKNRLCSLSLFLSLSLFYLFLDCLASLPHDIVSFFTVPKVKMLFSHTPGVHSWMPLPPPTAAHLIIENQSL